MEKTQEQSKIAEEVAVLQSLDNKQIKEKQENKQLTSSQIVYNQKQEKKEQKYFEQKNIKALDVPNCQKKDCIRCKYCENLYIQNKIEKHQQSCNNASSFSTKKQPALPNQKKMGQRQQDQQNLKKDNNKIVGKIYTKMQTKQQRKQQQQSYSGSNNQTKKNILHKPNEDKAKLNNKQIIINKSMSGQSRQFTQRFLNRQKIKKINQPTQIQRKVEQNGSSNLQISYTNHQGRIQSNMPNKSSKSNESKISEKLPCAFCSTPITFEQMVEHHNSCQMAFKCGQCQDIFPLFALQQHMNVCSKAKKKYDYKTNQSYIPPPPNIKDKNKKFMQQIEQLYQKATHPKIEKQNQGDDDNLSQHIKKQILLHPDIDPKFLKEHALAEYKIKLDQKKRRQAQNKKQFYKNIHNQKYKGYYGEQQGQKEQFVYNQRQAQSNYDSSDDDRQYIDEPDIQYSIPNLSNNFSHPKITGLKQYEINNLATDIFKKAENKQEDECNICTKQKQEGQLIIRLPCFHTFHSDCLIPWLQVKSLCPTCKYNLKQK